MATLDELVATTAQLRGERIDVVRSALPPGRYGLCMKTGSGHTIHVDERLTGDLYSVTVLHELGHILLGHNDVAEHSTDRLTSLLTGGGTESICCVSPMSRQWAVRETEAERFASTVSRRARRGLLNGRASRLDEAFG